MLNIAGFAAYNGLTFIDVNNSRVIKAIRDDKGEISVNEAVFLSKLLFYEQKLSKMLSKIPVIYKLIKTLILLLLPAISICEDLVKNLLIIKKWNLKKIINILLILLSIILYVISDTCIFILPLVPLIFLLRKEAKQTLKYHGAEHKVVNMYENKPYNSCFSIKDAENYSRIHDRCGTNLLFIVIPFMLVFYLMIEILDRFLAFSGIIELTGSLLLLAAGIRLLKLFQKPVYKKFLRPGRFIQKYFTTKEPEKEHLEVGLTALNYLLCK